MCYTIIQQHEDFQMRKKLQVGVLASGGGTDLQSIIDACENNRINAQVAVVVSDNCDAYCMKRAEKHSINCSFISAEGLTRKEHDSKVDKLLCEHKVDLVVGAGYMRIMSPGFVKKWYGSMINIHPALLPSFKGANGQGDAVDYGVKITGCTTHFIDEEMDHGPIILQAAVKVLSDDTRDTLASRILEVEHQILPRTIDLFEQKRLEIIGRKVMIAPGDSWKDKYPVIDNVLYSIGY